MPGQSSVDNKPFLARLNEIEIGPDLSRVAKRDIVVGRLSVLRVTIKESVLLIIMCHALMSRHGLGDNSYLLEGGNRNRNVFLPPKKTFN